jgi:hypothetical protein
MARKSGLWLLGAVALLATCLGCASPYHSYPSGCCIPYAYCLEPPLPYATYESCHCPTPVAAERHARQGAASADPSSGDLKTADGARP